MAECSRVVCDEAAEIVARFPSVEADRAYCGDCFDMLRSLEYLRIEKRREVEDD